MTAYQIWKKMIMARVYAKEVITMRVNTIYAVGQLTDDEYMELIGLIEATYPDVV